jgi:hypothetical protein
MTNAEGSKASRLHNSHNEAECTPAATQCTVNVQGMAGGIETQASLCEA